MNRSEASQLCGYISNMWPQFKVTDATIDTYADVFADESMLAARTAVVYLTRNDQKWPPSASEILTAIRKATQDDAMKARFALNRTLNRDSNPTTEFYTLNGRQYQRCTPERLRELQASYKKREQPHRIVKIT